MSTPDVGLGASTATAFASAAAVDSVSAERLADVVPALAWRVERVMQALAILGHPLRVTQGRRTDQEQLALYQSGRTRPGKILSNADGSVNRSLHQDGRAVDVVFRAPGGISWEGPWELVGLAAEAVGLKWGGRFKSISDRPHLEWPYDRPEAD